MIPVLAASILLAQAVPSTQPSAGPTIAAPWKSAPPPDKSYYAHYVRQEADGTESLILGKLDICNCQPTDDAAMIQNSAQQVPGAHVARSRTMICGQQAERLVITGMADSQRNNSEILLFRQGDAMIILTYAFKLAAPLAEDEAGLLTLCPQANITTH